MKKSEEFVQKYKNKSLILSGMLFVFLFAPSISFGLPITVISYNYDLSLHYVNTSFDINIAENYSYTGTGTGPSIKHSMSGPDYFYTIIGEVSPFVLDSISLALDDASSRAVLTAEWYFTPNHDRIKFKFEYESLVGFTDSGGGGGSSISYSLTDVTDNYILANSSRDFDPSFPGGGVIEVRDYFVEDFTYNLSQDNIYRLKLFTNMRSHSLGRTRLGVNLSTVPEPSTMLLFSTGLAGLVGIRFRRKKK